MKKVVSCFVVNRGAVLLLRRGETAPSFAGKWSAVSGLLGENESVLEAGLREIGEETGLAGDIVVFLKQGEPVLVRDGGEWLVHPVLLESDTREVRLNWENESFAWVSFGDVGDYDTVPMLVEIFESLLKN